MSLTDAPPQAVLRLRHGNQVNMIGHKTIRPNLDPSFPTPVGHQFDISRIVFIAKKRLLPTIPALGYVMWQARNDQSCQSSHSHAENLTKLA